MGANLSLLRHTERVALSSNLKTPEMETLLAHHSTKNLTAITEVP